MTAGEGSEGLPEVLPSASFPFSLYRGAPAGEMTGMQRKHMTISTQSATQEMKKTKTTEKKLRSITMNVKPVGWK